MKPYADITIQPAEPSANVEEAGSAFKSNRSEEAEATYAEIRLIGQEHEAICPAAS